MGQGSPQSSLMAERAWIGRLEEEEHFQASLLTLQCRATPRETKGNEVVSI